MTEQEINLRGCLQKDSLPLDNSGNMECDQSYELKISTNEVLYEVKMATMYIPYPRAGHWFFAVKTYCSQMNGTE